MTYVCLLTHLPFDCLTTILLNGQAHHVIVTLLSGQTHDLSAAFMTGHSYQLFSGYMTPE